jgi:hypothetical protein
MVYCFTLVIVVVVVVVVGITDSGSHYYYWQQWWCIQISWRHRNIVDLVQQQPKASNRQATKDGHSSNIPTTSSSCGTHNIDDDKVIHASMMQSLWL